MAVAARICCLDLDSFFVSVERLFDPSLIGKPVIVGATGWRGVVVSASYEVRPLGVHAGMSIAEARRLAPHAIYVAPRHGVYSEKAAAVKAVLLDRTPAVQTASIDEFFLDFRGCERLYHRPGDADGDATIERVVRDMREAVQREVGLPASAGIGATRPIAKMASGVAKPAGVRMVRGGDEPAFVRDLPVRKFPGIGPVAEQALNSAGIFTLGQLLEHPEAHAAEAVQQAVFPEAHAELGRDRPAFQEHDEHGRDDGSISNERTFMADLGDRQAVRDQLHALCERVCWRVRQRGMRARTVGLKLRYSDFDTLTRHRTIPPTHAEADVWECLLELLERAWTRPERIRLLGVQLSNFVREGPQLELPLRGRPEQAEAIDAVRARFGFDAIRLGATVRGGDR